MAGGHVKNGHPNVWAFLTLIAFPIVLLSTDILGARGLWPFALAMGATLLILALEAIIRGKIWPFEPGYAEHLGHPDLPMRLAIFMAACLFIIQTAFFIAVSVDSRFDESIMTFILRRQCATSRASGDPVCAGGFSKKSQVEMTSQKTADTVGFAIRTQAAKLWFPGAPLPTCAQRIIGITAMDMNGQRVASIVQCTSWKITSDLGLKKETSMARFVGVQLAKDPSGFLRVTAWTDDYTTSNWDAVLGPIAESSRTTAQTLSIYPDFSTVLEAESLGRAQAIINQ